MKKFIAIILILTTFVFAQENRTYTYAHVTHSKAIYDYQYERVYEPCEEVYYRNDYNEPSYESSNGIGLDTIVGATIGIAIGNQIGKGNGRDVAKIAGGILGATIANNTRGQRASSQYNNNRSSNNCSNNYSQRKVRVLSGYKNYFMYDNRQYFKITKNPKNQIRITKTISF